ncbi:MAG: sigma-54-dependent transcriptional regulator [Acidithiobacillales bacterium]
MAQVLLVDDEAHMRRILSVILKEEGHVVTQAAGTEEARKALAARQFDLVITDQKMPDGDGLALLAAAREIDPSLPGVLITAHATVELAVAALRQGAFDFITKPFAPETVRAVVRRACERTELVRENERLRGAVARLGGRGELVGGSEAMARVRDLIARVAPTNATVLITGETGSGKELVARALHAASPRARQPFVAVNCAAFPETLLESELFGHEKGAFTGADRARQGLFEAAHSGTLFLDETAEMTLPLQARLLRVLVDGEVVRVGATVPRLVDVRILAATHRNLLSRVSDRLFREDLFYRLAVIPLEVPPLRDHLEDLPDLVDHFLTQVSRDLKIPRRTVSPAAFEKLKRYRFPGNARELRNLIERASILAPGPELRPEDFPLSVGDEPAGGNLASGPPGVPPATFDLKGTLEDVERELLKRALAAAKGVRAEAARRLGISRSDMAYKIRKYALKDEPTA